MKRANFSLIIAVAVGILFVILAFTSGLLGAVFGGGTREDVALEDLIQEQAGPFELQEVEEFPEGIALGAEEALTATYEGPGNASLVNNVLDMPSSEEAEQLRQQRLQEQPRGLDLQVVRENSLENEVGEDIGTTTVLIGEDAGTPVTAIFWTNHDLYSEAVADNGNAEIFFEGVDY